MPEEKTPGATVSVGPAVDCGDVAEHHLADRYVLGQLTPAEAEAFEDHYMSCETCVAAVERAELLVRGMKRLAVENLSARDSSAEASPGAQGQAANPADSFSPPVAGRPRAESPGGDLLTFDRQRRRSSVVRQSGALLAAALVGAVLTLPLWTGRGGAGGAAVELYHLQPERSVDEVPGYRLRVPTAPVVLALELAPPFYDSYRALLLQDGRELWRAEELALGERDTVPLSVPAQQLEAGSYQLRLEGLADGAWADAGRFGFTVVD